MKRDLFFSAIYVCGIVGGRVGHSLLQLSKRWPCHIWQDEICFT